jgi:RND superfamily putative drug exporter
VAIFGTATFWPMKVRARDHVDGWWGRTAGRLLAKPLLTLTVGVVALGALAAFVPQDRPAGFGGDTAAPAGSETAKGDAIVKTSFPKTSDTATAVVMAFGTSLWSDPGRVAHIEAQLRATGDFTKVTSPFDQLGSVVAPEAIVAVRSACGPALSLPAFQGGLSPSTSSSCRSASPIAYQAYVATARTMSADGRTLVFQTAMSAGAGASTAALNAVLQVRDHLATVGQHVSAKEVGFYGFAAILSDVSSLSSRDLRLMVPLAALAIGLILALVLRSLIAPLYLIASVVLSYLASLGFAVIVFMKIGGESGLIYFLPFMLFLFLLALGEDYNILVMTRIREETRKQPLKQAVITAIGTTGTTVTSAGLVLAGTFVVFGIVIGSSGGTGSSAFNAVAYGLAAGILMDTFIVRTVLVPTIVVLLGRWNWWPSKPSVERNLHDVEVQQ